jgi:hypothetical protein
VLEADKTHSKGGRFAMSLPHASLFAQLLDLVPRPEFERLARLHGVEARSKGFSSWDRFVAMLFCRVCVTSVADYLIFCLKRNDSKAGG